MQYGPTVPWTMLISLGFGAVGCVQGHPPAEHPETVHRPPLGTAHPLYLVDAEPSGRWVVACQAREDTDGNGRIEAYFPYGRNELTGDVLRPYVMFEDEELAIDEFVAADRLGRQIAFFRDGELIVLDTVDRVEVNVTRTSEGRPSFETVLRSGAFDDSGRRFVYLEVDPRGEQVVVRDLRSGEELRPDVGPGYVTSAHLLGNGAWLSVSFLGPDPSAPRLEQRSSPSTPRRSSGGGLVWSSIGTFSCIPFRHQPVEHMASARVRTIHVESERHGPQGMYYGHGIVLSIYVDGWADWLSADGSVHRVSLEACVEPLILAIWSTPPALRVSCWVGDRRVPRTCLVAGGAEWETTCCDVGACGAALGAPDYETNLDPVELRGARGWARDRDWSETAPGGRTRAVFQRITIPEDEEFLHIRDEATGTVTRLDHPCCRTSSYDSFLLADLAVHRFGPWYAVPNSSHAEYIIVRRDDSRVVGSVERLPAAIDERGTVLFESGVQVLPREATPSELEYGVTEPAERMPMGPLRWVRPVLN